MGLLHLTVSTDFYQQQHAHLADLAVDAAAEGRGIGRALLQHAEAWALERGFAWLKLSVFAQNTHARAVYERAGFGEDIVKPKLRRRAKTSSPPHLRRGTNI